jgi:hypothetical protein
MAKLWIRGKNPKNKGKLASIAVGVVSGTRDYTERPFSRPEIFSVKISFSSRWLPRVLDVQLCQRFNVTFKDKGAARFLERGEGGGAIC